MDDDYGIAMIADKVVIIASKAHVQKQPLPFRGNPFRQSRKIHIYNRVHKPQ